MCPLVNPPKQAGRELFWQNSGRVGGVGGARLQFQVGYGYENEWVLRQSLGVPDTPLGPHV